MIRIIVICMAAIVIIAAGIFMSMAFIAQRADYGWSPDLKSPAYTRNQPHVLIDEAHNNALTAAWYSRYWQFGRLLRADGYDVERGSESFSLSNLAEVDIVVIANASGASRPQFLGINLPGSTDKERGDPAFTNDEIAALVGWVKSGGSLLLIADHAPFGKANADLAAAFGITMYKGFTEIPGESSDPMIFSTDNGRLGTHVILTGNGGSTAISRVMTFTGQSLDAPSDASILLKLPASAVEYVAVNGSDSLTESNAGSAQGVAMTFGNGRVVVLGEAAMLTAQVADRIPFGMNLPENDNKQFALNIMHWLSRLL